tara:strand:+ start:1227 stop:2783 length:1557 start_codon:yes stop_codon:yes gene_type:complete
METIQEALDSLTEVQTQSQRLDTLIRQGLLPARQLPILHRALSSVKMGKVLTPYEREALSKLLDKMMGFQFGDDITYNRARLHTQKTKYQTEERTVAKEEEDIKVYDGSKDEEEAKRDKKVKKNGKTKKSKESENGSENPEQEEVKEANHAAAARPADEGSNEGDVKKKPAQGGSEQNPEIIDGPKQMSKPDIREGLLADLDAEGKRSRDARRFKRLGRRSKEDVLKSLPPSLRKEKKKMDESRLPEELKNFNDLYKQNLETALANVGVENIRDINKEDKEDIFKQVDEASYTKKQLKMAKGIAFDKRHKGGDMTGAYKKMEKIKKGLGDTPEASKALRQANEQLENPLEEGALKSFAMDHGYDFDNPPKDSAAWLSKKVKANKKKLVSDRKVKENLNIFDTRRAMKEGAREDAMRDMKSAGATKGMAQPKKEPKPGKSKHDGSENKGPDHIVSQLRKAVSLGDKHDGVKFQDGKTHKVSRTHAAKFLNKYLTSKPADKLKMQGHAHASHDNFKKHLD